MYDDTLSLNMWNSMTMNHSSVGRCSDTWYGGCSFLAIMKQCGSASQCNVTTSNPMPYIIINHLEIYFLISQMEVSKNKPTFEMYAFESSLKFSNLM